MFRLHSAFALPLLVVLAGCVDSAGPQIEVNLSESSFTSPATVRFTVHNAGDTYAYFSGCEGPIPVVLEQESNGSWQEVAAFNTACTGVRAQLSMPPGASHVDSIPAAGAGQYRLNVWFGSEISAPYVYAVRSENFQVH